MGNKRLVVLAAAISGALVLSACGGSDKSSGSESSGEGMKLGLIQEARRGVLPGTTPCRRSSMTTLGPP